MEGKKSKRNYKNRQEMMLKVLTLLSVALLMAAVDASTSNDTYTRNDFPPHFLFGASTSAFQVYFDYSSINSFLIINFF